MKTTLRSIIVWVDIKSPNSCSHARRSAQGDSGCVAKRLGRARSPASQKIGCGGAGPDHKKRWSTLREAGWLLRFRQQRRGLQQGRLLAVPQREVALVVAGDQQLAIPRRRDLGQQRIAGLRRGDRKSVV